MAQQRRRLSDIIFGRNTQQKRYNFFADDYPISNSGYMQGYSSKAGLFDINSLGSGQSNSAVTSCLNVLSRSFAEARLVINTKNQDGETEYVPNHPLEQLMVYPNEFMTGDLLASYIITATSVMGDAYILKQKNNAGQVVALLPLMPQYVTPQGTKETLITSYEYEMQDKKVLIPREDIIHIRFGIDPDDHKSGLAPIKTVLREIYGDESAGQLSTALLSNMGVPSVILSPTDDFGLSEDEAEQISRTYQKKVGGSQRGMPLILSGSMKVEKMSFSPKDLDIGMLRQIPESRISAVLGVPAILSGLQVGLENGTYSNARELREAFTENTLIPLWRQVAQEIENQLLKVNYPDAENMFCEYDISQVRALQTDVDQLFNRMNVAVQGGWATVGEARRAVGLPTDDSHDVYLMNISTMQIKKDELGDTPQNESQVEVSSLVNAWIDKNTKSAEYKIIKKEQDDDGKDVYCVYNEKETRSFGCYPTRELAESRLAQIHRFGEERYKEQVGKDEFTTMEEARDRAEELGCSGTHTHDKDGNLIYMPCSTHEEYEQRLADNGES